MPKKSGPRPKHIPQRTCVGCRQVNAKRTLIRIVRTADGIRVDETGKLPGRGAYLHDARACWEKALKGSLAHALKTEIQPAELQTLKEIMLALPEEDSAETPEHP